MHKNGGHIASCFVHYDEFPGFSSMCHMVKFSWKKFPKLEKTGISVRTLLCEAKVSRARTVILHKNLCHIGLKFVYYDEKNFCAK